MAGLPRAERALLEARRAPAYVSEVDAHLTKRAIMPELSVVAPLYNESENVQPLVDWILEALATYPGSFEVLLVDDGSRDDTWERIASAHRAARSHRSLFRLRAGSGGRHCHTRTGTSAAVFDCRRA